MSAKTRTVIALMIVVLSSAAAGSAAAKDGKPVKPIKLSEHSSFEFRM
jgi:hypothetical protein